MHKTTLSIISFSFLLIACQEEPKKDIPKYDPSILEDSTKKEKKKESFVAFCPPSKWSPQSDTDSIALLSHTPTELQIPIDIENITLIDDTNEVLENISVTDDTTIAPTEIVEPIKESIETPVFAAVKPSHHEFDRLLSSFVSSSGAVNYQGFKSKKTELDTYLKHLKNLPPTTEWTKNEKLAYWINLYNASTIQLILENYPVSSITTISGGKPWDKRFVQSGNKTYTLNEVENEIIRPRFKEPRIHMAVNCAAKSCPSLLNEAFSASKLNQQLDKQTKAFINNPKFNVVKNGSLQLSKIFEWYAVDFGGESGIRTFVKKYSDIDCKNNAKITFLEYNWDLNK